MEDRCGLETVPLQTDDRFPAFRAPLSVIVVSSPPQHRLTIEHAVAVFRYAWCAATSNATMSRPTAGSAST
jgi:hypothetical protein